MILMIEKGIRGGIWHAIHQYAKANNNYMKYCDENKKSSYLKYWDVILVVGGFKWVENTYQLSKGFIKNYHESTHKLYFLEVDFQYFEKFHGFHNDLPLKPERMRIEQV